MGSSAGGLVVPGRMTKDYYDYYNLFIEVFMRNEQQIASGTAADAKERTEFDDKLRQLLLQVERQANLGHIFPEMVQFVVQQMVRKAFGFNYRNRSE